MRRKAEGDEAFLDKNTEMASLKSLLPEEFEQHVQLNRARLLSYSLLLAEIMMYAKEERIATAETVLKVLKPQEDFGPKAKDLEKEIKGKAKNFDPKAFEVIDKEAGASNSKE